MVVLVGLCLAGGGAQCRNPGSTVPRFGTGGHDLDAPPSDPETQAAWDRLADARAEDPAGESARAIAEEILTGEPPLPLRLAALLAKAEHAYLTNADPVAIAAAAEGLSLGSAEASAEPQVLVDLARVRVRALVRGGDPAAAIAALEEPLVHARGGLDPAEERGLRAVAADRNGELAAAIVGLAQWRELLTDDDPTAPWIEQRIALLSDGIPPSALAELAAGMPSSPGRACLRARLPETLPEGSASLPEGMPAWVAACGQAFAGIGVLLPRSGPFAAFADEHLAAAVATVEVVRRGGPIVPLRFHDSGASASTARAAARSLIGEGARVLVGPVGARHVKAVANDVAEHVVLIVPGEGGGHAKGVAPSLERRVRALVEHAQASGRDRIVVLAPDNTYGRRAIKAAKASADGKLPKPLVVRTYPPSTTSFGPHVNPIMTALGGNAALLVPDTLRRTDMVVRQLARAGRMPARGEVPGLMVLATAEGLRPDTLSGARDVLDGVWVVPAAARGPQTEAFERAYLRLQGERPGDQALLVFYALQQAIDGQPGPGAATVTLTRVEGGQLVVQSAQSSG